MKQVRCNVNTTIVVGAEEPTLDIWYKKDTKYGTLSAWHLSLEDSIKIFIDNSFMIFNWNSHDRIRESISINLNNIQWYEVIYAV